MRGAKRLIEKGLLEQAKPDMSLSVHVLPMANTGQAVVQRGPIWASRDELTLKIDGPSTCHFALTPAQITTALYKLAESEGKSTEPVTFRVRAVKAEQAARYGWALLVASPVAPRPR